VVGGGDSAAEAAIGLARQRGNRVTLSYRKEKLVRIKRKNLVAVEELRMRGRLEVVLSSRVARIHPARVEMVVGEDETLEIDNDYVFIFAGGVPPFAFLKRIGIGFGGPSTTAGR
jgi:thioredoxin reductase